AARHAPGPSKRYVVRVDVLALGLAGGCRGSPASGTGGRLSGRELVVAQGWRAFAGGVATAAPARAAAVQELDGVGVDLGARALLAVLALPRAGLQAALDVDHRSLAQVLGADLGQVSLALVPGHDVVEVGELLALAVGPGAVAVGGDAEAGHGCAGWGVA